MTKRGMISGTVPKKGRRRLYISAAIGIGVVLISVGIWWYMTHKSTQRSPHEQDMLLNIAAQERFLQQNQDRPADTKALAWANLAVSYADIGECDYARNALEQARGIMPTDLQDSLTRTEKQVKAHCP